VFLFQLMIQSEILFAFFPFLIDLWLVFEQRNDWQVSFLIDRISVASVNLSLNNSIYLLQRKKREKKENKEIKCYVKEKVKPLKESFDVKNCTFQVNIIDWFFYSERMTGYLRVEYGYKTMPPLENFDPCC